MDDRLDCRLRDGAMRLTAAGDFDERHERAGGERDQPEETLEQIK